LLIAGIYFVRVYRVIGILILGGNIILFIYHKKI